MTTHPEAVRLWRYMPIRNGPKRFDDRPLHYTEDDPPYREDAGHTEHLVALPAATHEALMAERDRLRAEVDALRSALKECQKTLFEWCDAQKYDDGKWCDLNGEPLPVLDRIDTLLGDAR